MARSFNKIDYRLRPAKYAERMMICDLLRRLRFDSLETYLYVGLGSIYFADFLLFHRQLGVRDMVNIEEDVGSKPRFTANAPLKIQLLFGKTNAELPNVKLDERRAIIWLDYDGRLNNEVMLDVAAIGRRAISGSVFLISLQCTPEVPGGVTGRVEIDTLTAKIGKQFVDSRLTDMALLGDGTGSVFYSALSNALQASVAARNAVVAPVAQIRLQQVVFFRYADGAEMMTVGWLFYSDAERHLYALGQFPTLAFFQSATDSTRIDVPKVTSIEARLLQSQMPLTAGTTIAAGAIPTREVAKYELLYRYLPSFITAEWH